MRSASMSKIFSRFAEPEGNRSWYTVTFWLVYALLCPPNPSMTRSNSPGPYFLAPLNSMCSKKCEMPVVPGRSLREPIR